MDSTPSKRHKPPTIPETPTAAAAAAVKEDRISNLPDSILCHILSKLPTKTAIATAVLSSKWKPLFASIVNLSLVIDDTAPNKPQPNPNFVNFMYHLLTVTLRDVTCIEKFVLHCNHDYGNSHIDAWISTVLGLKVSSLTLFFHVENTGVSIESLFQCETLEDLLWCQHFYAEVPDTIFLPNLTRLYLAFVKFPDSESFDIVISGCPVLERLSLDNCKFKETYFLFIRSPSALRLSF
ncbi:F-box/LRR-repeat protein At4g14096-like [Rhododendron vialii]|uniref:F-box/LRR-repeat protein At4g14096-like n=1 Tax=Rhododendron vialii TaxID=182163 RepID=UPI00265F7936|nr:F-box/LRR-repeat protein At4g14096-like [Rhododendron vialii]